MSERLSSLLVGCALVALAWSGAPFCLLQAVGAEGGRPIEFSEPRTGELSTNLHQLTNKKDSLKSLEEDLYKSLQPFSPNPAIEDAAMSVSRPSAGQAVPSKRAKELMERRKNYMFMTPEDLMKGQTPEEVFKLPEYDSDGQEKKKLSPLETYYQRQDAKRDAVRKLKEPTDEMLPGNFGTPNSHEDSASREEMNLPASLRSSELALKKLFGTDSAETGSVPALKRNPYSDIFGLGDNTPSPEDIQKRKKFVENLGTLGDPVQRPALGSEGLNPFGGSLGIVPKQPQPMPALADLPGTKPHDGLDTQLGTINPIFVPTGPADVNAQLLGQSGLLPAAPKVEVPKAAVATPTFTSPKRPF